MNYTVVDTNLPVGGAISTHIWLGGSVLGVAGCPESKFIRNGGAAVKKMIYLMMHIHGLVYI